jgi:mannitol-specific phosphotransferase system IIBC component
VVLLKLEVKLCTPTPPALGPILWQPKTPSNAIEIDSQTTLIIKKIRDHKSSSPDSIIEMILQVKKGSTLKDHSHTLLEARVAKLKAANNAASKRKKHKKKQIQAGGTLSQAKAEEIVRQRDTEAEAEAERVEAGSSNKGVRRCKMCSEAGHNKRTCKKDAVEVT